MSRMIIEIVVWEKSPGDWRSALDWEDEDLIRYRIRGYGDTPGMAADDAHASWLKDPDYFSDEVPDFSDEVPE